MTGTSTKVADVVAANPAVWNAITCAEVNARLEDASAEEIADWAVATFGSRLAVAASMQDTILPHLFGTRLPGVDVLFLETGYHFAQTIETRDEAARRFPITIVNVTPRQSVAEQDAEFGSALYSRDPGLCCARRKVAPLQDALGGYEVWFTGVRREEAPTRANTPLIAWDERNGLVKVNPVAAWGFDDLLDYAGLHQVPVNLLVSNGYPSIGCEPCTARVEPGADPRSGRWAGLGKTECGLHL